MADHRIAAVADLLGISVSLLRTWSLEFAAYLSEGAQWHAADRTFRPSPRYSDQDIVLLCRAQRLREQGLSFDQIRDRLDSYADQHAADMPMSVAAPERAEVGKHAYELALDALHDALRTQGTLIEHLQQETLLLRSTQEQLAQANSNQRSHYLAIIRLLVARELKVARRRPAEV